MRNMSFSLTKDQLLAGRKTVTRRKGSAYLKPGERVQAVEKIQGLKRGERVKPLCVIEVVSVRREPLALIDQVDVIREGFPELTVAAFIQMFCKHHAGVGPETEITRIEFKVLKKALIFYQRDSARSPDEGQHFAEVISDLSGDNETVLYTTGWYTQHGQAINDAQAWMKANDVLDEEEL